MVSECADGFPDHGKFAEIFKMADTPQGILELIHNPNFKEVDQWQVQTSKYSNFCQCACLFRTY